MTFTVDDDTLSLSLTLDDEPVDFTAAELGSKILEAAEASMARNAVRESGPDGRQWAPLRPRTIAKKGFDTRGFETGAMIAGLTAGEWSIEPRTLRWRFPSDDPSVYGRTHAFHNGNPRNRQVPRPIIGWSDDAKTEALLLIREQ